MVVLLTQLDPSLPHSLDPLLPHSLPHSLEPIPQDDASDSTTGCTYRVSRSMASRRTTAIISIVIERHGLGVGATGLGSLPLLLDPTRRHTHHPTSPTTPPTPPPSYQRHHYNNDDHHRSLSSMPITAIVSASTLERRAPSATSTLGAAPSLPATTRHSRPRGRQLLAGSRRDPLGSELTRALRIWQRHRAAAMSLVDAGSLLGLAVLLHPMLLASDGRARQLGPLPRASLCVCLAIVACRRELGNLATRLHRRSDARRV